MISGLVNERSNRRQEVGREITSKWGQSQEIAGPVLVIPYEKEIISKVKEGGTLKTTVSYQTEYLHLLPNKLTAVQEVKPEIRKRGLYRVVVYNSVTRMNGDFSAPDLEKEGIKPETVAWDKARLVLGVSDLKGLSAFPEVTWNGKKTETQSAAVALFTENLSAPVDLSQGKAAPGTFTVKLDIRGADFISIAPLARENGITIKGDWGSPGFDGDYLPAERTVKDNFFEARWSVQSLDRKIPQQWTHSGVGFAVENTDEGRMVAKETPLAVVKVTFPEGVDLYQQTERTLKYGILVIVLAFLALLFTEILRRTPFHMIHYGLIGAALVIFYTLLLSFSEQIGFNAAYLAAFVATNGLITWFVRSISKSTRTALIFACILTLFFGFNFVLMQLEDYALLVGSVGLFVILSVLMYLTSKINWLTGGTENKEG
ncbi:MAG: cell envelope integrity protein CreD [Leadbetterella sp.]|nr:cell envelope integrity protein CreD [Leadbetterella sp.]